MALTALESLVVFGQAPGQGVASGTYNNAVGPMATYAGQGLLDVRASYQPGQADTSIVYQWVDGGSYPVVDQIPSAISAVNIAAAQTPTAGTPLTLVSTTGAGITVGATAINRVTGASIIGVI